MAKWQITFRTSYQFNIRMQIVNITGRPLQLRITIQDSPKSAGIAKDSIYLVYAFSDGNFVETSTGDFSGPLLTLFEFNHSVVVLIGFVANQNHWDV
jgi:hypothetical protein